MIIYFALLTILAGTATFLFVVDRKTANAAMLSVIFASACMGLEMGLPPGLVGAALLTLIAVFLWTQVVRGAGDRG